MTDTSPKEKPRKEFLALAEACGAQLTGEPDGSDAVTLVFTIEAWRAFDRATLPSPQSPEPVAQVVHGHDQCGLVDFLEGRLEAGTLLYSGPATVARAAAESPAGFLNAPLVWSSRQSETVVKISKNPQSQYGFIHPVYGAPLPQSVGKRPTVDLVAPDEAGWSLKQVLHNWDPDKNHLEICVSLQGDDPHKRVRREMRAVLAQAHAQMRHLIHELSTAVDDGGVTTYVPPRADSLLYSNTINAMLPIADKMTELLSSPHGADT